MSKAVFLLAEALPDWVRDVSGIVLVVWVASMALTTFGDEGGPFELVWAISSVIGGALIILYIAWALITGDQPFNVPDATNL